MKKIKDYINTYKRNFINNKRKRKIKSDAVFYMYYVSQQLRENKHYMFSFKKGRINKHSVMCRYILLYKLKGLEKSIINRPQSKHIHITVKLEYETKNNSKIKG